MPAPPITLMLQELASGDKSVLDRLMPHVYTELRRLAGRQMTNERSSHTLQPTALVHEAYFRLVGEAQPDYRSRAHFLGVAARVMRQVLIDHARIHNAEKRGGGQPVLGLEEWMHPASQPQPSITALDDALRALENDEPLKARLIEMRFFGGLTAEESAEVEGLPLAKVRAELRVAQAWLRRELDRIK